MASRAGAADRQRARAEARPKPERDTFIGGSDLDSERSRWCWDLVWADPAYVPIADHLDLRDPDLLLAGVGPVPSPGPLAPGATALPGGHARACIERAGELLAWLMVGRHRAGGFAEEVRWIVPGRGPLVELVPRFGPPQQPRILVLVRDQLVLDWISAVEGSVLDECPGIGVEVDHPLRGMSAAAAKNFMRCFIDTTPCWRDFPGDELERGSRREQMLEHLWGVPDLD